MCGIFGMLNPVGQSVDPSVLESAVNSLRHRGPDDFGLFHDKNFGFGHRRLSIIDLSGGKQPIHNEDESIWVICNGEIYNYQELTRELISKGHRFYTKSDSEVLVHLYEEYGEDGVKRLNGIFSYAIWDQKNRKLFFARDQLGVKPFYYYQDQSRFMFSSEIKAILQCRDAARAVNINSLSNYFSLNYATAPQTMFQNIYSLPAGHYGVYENGRLKLVQYWDVQLLSQDHRSETEIALDLKTRISDSVKMQMVSDVPVGAFLSGGLDSSTIVKFASQMSRGKLKTFNVRFNESSYDESEYAQLISKKFQTEHFEVYCQPADYVRHLQSLVWHADNLTVDISMIGLHLVSKLASEHVKVVLSGDGADELFAGYPTYLADSLLRYYNSIPAFVRKQMIEKLVHAMPISEKKMSFEFKAKRFIKGAETDPRRAHVKWREIFNDHDKQELLVRDVQTRLGDSFDDVFLKYFNSSQGADDLSRYLFVDLKTWMVDSILTKVDTMSMAHALEVRVPFLNHELVEFSSKIPSRLKLHYFKGKHILKESMRGELPSEIINRKKAGFQIPIGEWFRKELKELLCDVVSKNNIEKSGLLEWRFVARLLDEHLSAREEHGYQLLSLLHFCLWYDQFISGRPVLKVHQRAA